MHDDPMFKQIASQAEHGHELAEHLRAVVARRLVPRATVTEDAAELLAELIDALATYDYHYERSLKRR
jgi:hypothetical protein